MADYTPVTPGLWKAEATELVNSSPDFKETLSQNKKNASVLQLQGMTLDSISGMTERKKNLGKIHNDRNMDLLQAGRGQPTGKRT